MTDRIPGKKYVYHPETGAPGIWQWLGTMGWVRVDAPAPKAKPKPENTSGGMLTEAVDKPAQRQFSNHDQSSFWDQDLVDQRRIMNTGQRAWLLGADAFLEDGARWDRVTNPYDAAAERARLGDQYVEMVEDYMYDGNRQFTQKGYDILADAVGYHAGSPFIDVFPQDVNPYFEILQSGWYNPFDDWGQSKDTQRLAGGAMDYMYQQTKGLENIKKREDAIKAWNSATKGMSSDEKRNLQMSQALYDQMGLGDIFGSGSSSSAPNSVPAPSAGNNVSSSGGGMLPTIPNRRERDGVWGAGYGKGGYGFLSPENDQMRKAVVTALEKNLLG